MFDLRGKVALVTGGNGGIGLGMAEGLARCGASVVVWGGNPAKNEAAGERLRAQGGEVLVQACDVSQEDEVEARMEELFARFGGSMPVSPMPAARCRAPPSTS